MYCGGEERRACALGLRSSGGRYIRPRRTAGGKAEHCLWLLAYGSRLMASPFRRFVPTYVGIQLRSGSFSFLGASGMLSMQDVPYKNKEKFKEIRRIQPRVFLLEFNLGPPGAPGPFLSEPPTQVGGPARADLPRPSRAPIANFDAPKGLRHEFER